MVVHFIACNDCDVCKKITFDLIKQAVTVLTFLNLFFRTIKYLKEASITRTCAITGFFVSIPVFLTGKEMSMSIYFPFE